MLSNWIIRLEIPAKNFSWKSQLEVQLDSSDGNFDWIFQLGNPTEIQMDYLNLISSWKSQLESQIDFPSGNFN